MQWTLLVASQSTTGTILNHGHVLLNRWLIPMGYPDLTLSPSWTPSQAVEELSPQQAAQPMQDVELCPFLRKSDLRVPNKILLPYCLSLEKHVCPKIKQKYTLFNNLFKMI